MFNHNSSLGESNDIKQITYWFLFRSSQFFKLADFLKTEALRVNFWEIFEKSLKRNHAHTKKDPNSIVKLYFFKSVETFFEQKYRFYIQLSPGPSYLQVSNKNWPFTVFEVF